MWIVAVSCTVLLWGLMALRTAQAVARTPRLQIVETTEISGKSAVAVLIPVRDEMANLPRLIDGLQAQRGVDLQVLIYDDLSTDGSGAWLDQAAARLPWLSVVHGAAEPPAGWCGKPHALVRATEAYAGDAQLWLFLDADVELADDAIAALVAELERSEVDVVSPLPTLAADSFWAALLGPNFASVATLPHPPERVNDPAQPAAFFNGQVVLMRRDAYLASGGFAAVAGEVLEDVALAQRLKQGGARLRVVDGQRHFTTHMYRSLAEHVRGWGKNIFELVGRSRRRALSLSLFMLVLPALPLLCLGLAIAALVDGDCVRGVIALLGYVVPTAIQIAIRARARATPLYAPLALLGAGVVVFTMLRAALGQRAVSWKGRTYDGPHRS